MTKMEFGADVSRLQKDGVNLARADEPDFELARWHLKTAKDVVITSVIPLKSEIFTSRIRKDLGEVDIREGLYLYIKKGLPEDETLEYVDRGISQIQLSYDGLAQVFYYQQPELNERGWVESVNNNLAIIRNSLHRAARSAQLVSSGIWLEQPVTLDPITPPDLNYQKF